MKIHDLSASGASLTLVMLLTRLLPEKPMLRLAATLADRAASEDSPSVRAVHMNQAIVRGLSPKDPSVERAVRAVYHSAARGYVAHFRALARGKDAVLRACELSPELEERALAALSRGHGLIIVGPHVSAFDLFLLTVGARGYSAQGLSPPLPTAAYKMQNRMRTQFGTETTPISVESLRLAIRRLRAGGLVLTGLDRPVPKSEGLTFFGRPCNLPLGYARLAVRTGAALLPAVVTPLGEGRYRTVAGELMYPRSSQDEDAARGMAQAALDQIEPIVRQYADEWLMFFPVWPDA